MGVLYHISMDDSHKSLFVYTEPPAMAVLYDRLLAVPDVRREPELIALAVNLTQNARCAAALVEGPKFDRLMRRAMERRDDLLFKVMRNVSQVRRSCSTAACMAVSLTPASLTGAAFEAACLTIVPLTPVYLNSSLPHRSRPHGSVPLSGLFAYPADRLPSEKRVSCAGLPAGCCT